MTDCVISQIIEYLNHIPADELEGAELGIANLLIESGHACVDSHGFLTEDI